MRRLSALVSLAGLVGVSACAPPPPSVARLASGAPPTASSTRGLVRNGTPAEVDIAAARERGAAQAFAFRPYGPEAFEEARREGKLVLLDGAAEWCHWCHVMDATTYRDAEVGRLLRDRFIAVRVDIDEHPDVAERYGAWGWPATILFAPSGEEIGKFRGYIAPGDLKRALAEAVDAVKRGRATAEPASAALPGPSDVAPPVSALPWIAGRISMDLDGWYDPKEGGWGQRQKAPFGANVEFEIARAGHGDAAALARATFTLAKERALIDPVWGGIYQYSAGSTWDEPHYEKLMPFQTSNLEAYARAYAKTRDPALLADARKIAEYMASFLSNPDGAFLVSQDADLGGHDPSQRFVDGDVYYRLADVERRRLGLPRVDDHVYGFENGLAIAAFVTLFEVTQDAAVLARARRAADAVTKAIVGEGGLVKRGAADTAPRFLADAASLGWGFARLAEALGPSSPEGEAWKRRALAIAAKMTTDLGDADASAGKRGAFWDHTVDEAAQGVFARRAKPMAPNLLAARFFAALARITGDASFKERGLEVLAAVCTPRALDERGRQLGEVLLALDELGAVRW